MNNFSKTKSLLTSLVIAIIIVLLAPTALSLFPRVEEIVKPLNVAEKLLANNNGEYGYIYLVDNYIFHLLQDTYYDSHHDNY